MEFLKKIAQGCRQHYEKVILTGALIGLGLAVWFLYEASLAEETKTAEYLKGVAKRPVKPVPPLDLARTQAALKKASSPPSFNLSSGHYLFNPVTWQLGRDGNFIKIATGKEVGLSVLIASRIRPLNLSIALDRVATSGEPPNVTVNGYQMVSTNDAAPSHLRRLPQFATVNATNRNAVFILREVKGPPEAPTELIVELRDTGERVSVLPNKPFTRTVDYEADLTYPITGKTYPRQRKGKIITAGGDTGKIAEITADTVVLSDESNQKTYNVRLAGTK